MSTASTPRVWLDDLPDDVNLHIVQLLRVVDASGRMGTNAFNLAQVSEKQTRILVRAMENNFDLRNIKKIAKHQTAESCCATLSSYVRHLDIRYEPNDQEKRFHDILLKSPNLESLTALPEPELLTSIADIQSLRSLSFTSADYWCTPAESIPLLFETLSKLNLNALHVDCHLFESRDDEESDNDEDAEFPPKRCGLRKLTRYDPDPAALGSCCPNLRTLSIRCTHMSKWKPLPDFLDGFKNLREFTPDFAPEEVWRKLESKKMESQFISDAVAERMRRFESVHLRNVAFLTCSAADIGAPVKTLVHSMWSYRRTYYYEGMSFLSKCPNLVTLVLCVNPGVEISFPIVARSFRCLTTLSIAWDVDRVFRGMRTVAIAYHCPSPQLLKAIEEQAVLASLSLTYVTLAIDDVKRLLRKMGNRLKHLTTSIRSQEEPLAERLTLLFEELATSNQELRNLNFEDYDDVQKDRRRRQQQQRHQIRWGSTTFRVMEPRMHRAFYMLRRNAKLLDWERTVRSVLYQYRLRLTPGIGEEHLDYARPNGDC